MKSASLISNGDFFTTNWSGTAVDASHPDGRAYVREMIRRTVEDWGFTYLKLDGIHMAMASRQTYPRRDFVQDRFGDASRRQRGRARVLGHSRW